MGSINIHRYEGRELVTKIVIDNNRYKQTEFEEFKVLVLKLDCTSLKLFIASLRNPILDLKPLNFSSLHKYPLFSIL